MRADLAACLLALLAAAGGPEASAEDISVHAGPDCHPCPAPFSPSSCPTLSATALPWDRAGSGSF